MLKRKKNSIKCDQKINAHIIRTSGLTNTFMYLFSKLLLHIMMLLDKLLGGVVRQASIIFNHSLPLTHKLDYSSV